MYRREVRGEPTRMQGKQPGDQRIATVRGMGYRLESEPAEEEARQV
jgi:DNA-binding response OmpR family regulator